MIKQQISTKTYGKEAIRVFFIPPTGKKCNIHTRDKTKTRTKKTGAPKVLKSKTISPQTKDKREAA